MRTLRWASRAAATSVFANMASSTACEHEKVAKMLPGFIDFIVAAFKRLYP